MFSSVTGTSIPTADNLDFSSTFSFEASENKKTLDSKTMSTEEYIREYFSDIPVMIEIARCESRFRHYGRSGEVLRGEVVPEDRGVMQVNEYYHLKTANRLGFDIYTIEGNTSYARYLYEKQGTRPWRSSSKCWGVSYPAEAKLAMAKR